MRSILTIPGHRYDFFSKALRTSADGLMIDLEDGVGPGYKSIARDNIRDANRLLASTDKRIFVRLNQLESPYWSQDVGLISEDLSFISGVVIPKAENPIAIEKILPGFKKEIMLSIETPKGLLNASDILNVDGIAAVSFGAGDYSAAIRAEPDWGAMLYARGKLINLAAFYGLEIYDSPYFQLKNDSGMRQESELSRRMGFSGKIAVHPNQVDIINECFTPTDDEAEIARKILEAAKSSGGNAVMVEGRLVDGPIIDHAAKVVQDWARCKGD